MKPHENDNVHEFDTGTDDVEVVHRINRLKEKVLDERSQGATGFIDSALIKKAQGVVERSHEVYTKEAHSALDLLVSVWSRLKNGTSQDVSGDIGELCKLSNRLKDMSSTYGYDLLSHFGESLRDFSERLDISRRAHQVIVQAHIDVMWIAFNEKLRDMEGKKAEELKTIVSKAIEKFG